MVIAPCVDRLSMACARVGASGHLRGSVRATISDDAEAGLSVVWLVIHDPHAAAEDLGIEEGAHELLVCAVAERLCLVAERVGVLDGIVAQLAGEAAGDDLLGGPLIHGVGGDLDLEHAVGEVLAHAGRLEAGTPRRAFERLELGPALVDALARSLDAEGRAGPDSVGAVAGLVRELAEGVR